MTSPNQLQSTNRGKSTPTPVGLTFFTTGTCKIRPSMRSQPTASYTDKFVAIRRLRSFTDRRWSDPIPIGVFVVSHPDGPILFDTGESPLCNDPGYLPLWSPTKLVCNVTISPEDGIVRQLLAHGIDPKTLQAIVLSHLHGDHAGGLKDLAAEAPDVPVYVSREQWAEFGNSPFHATISGCVPQHWPKDFDPKMIEFTDHPVGPWKQSGKVTPDGKVVVVPTPGHVPGHISLVVYGDNEDGTQTTYFLPGDATYGVDLLDKEEPDGVNDDPMTALQSLKLIKEFARQTDLVVLPSHDPNVASTIPPETMSAYIRAKDTKAGM
ncbi:uncharacterized protein DNG_06866 [Cephalotrichum gorgonifer]|uniref:Metallo-beta-lactamase domain-containing protein n=1 Tax=Cephalotrichum gorgonifer TaxID=2041049 RepID=A0AAE8SWY4_9PEZI|nr:uncharacterized protein DNG_06866 [Cephalotrichum gorgonifer]